MYEYEVKYRPETTHNAADGVPSLRKSDDEQDVTDDKDP